MYIFRSLYSVNLPKVVEQGEDQMLIPTPAITLREGFCYTCSLGGCSLVLILKYLGGNGICQKYRILRKKACSVTDTGLNTTINRNPWLSLEMSATCWRRFYYSHPSSF